ncbi:MAG TPA: hypothetical protein VMQ46_09010 [Acidimicrobiia bacterium]|nr:hypothetical protein [Acidimicrobiia bacterium]
MQTSTKWIIGILGFLAVAVVVFGLAVLGLFLPVRVDSGQGGGGPTPGTEPPGVPGVPDGEWFGLVMVGEDETGEVTLGVDLAEMLTGQAAHDAAVEAGVISEGEDLPNDFFIDNPESVYELVYLADSPEITVLSGDDPSERLIIDVDQLVALYEGSYAGPPVYGIVAGEPIVMDLVIRDGLVADADAVYLP